jgi:hypothetical protein
MIKRKAQVGQNCQDNKFQRSSRSRIIIHFAVAANEYSNVVGERFWREYSLFFLAFGSESALPRSEQIDYPDILGCPTGALRIKELKPN